MVEYVKGIEAELSLDALCDAEGLGEGHVGEEPSRTEEGVKAGVADLPASGQCERAGRRTSQSAGVDARLGRTYVIGQRSNRRKVVPLPVDLLGTDAERLSWNEVRTAWAGIFDQAAFADARSPWETAAVVQCVGQLPSADQQVLQAVGVAEHPLAFADREFVHRADHEDAAAVVLIGTVRKLRIDGVVVGVVGVGVAVSVVGQELEAMAKAALDLDLKGFVVAAGVVAEVGQVDRAAGRSRMYQSSSVCISRARVCEGRHAVLEERTAIGLRNERNETARGAGR